MCPVLGSCNSGGTAVRLSVQLELIEPSAFVPRSAAFCVSIDFAGSWPNVVPIASAPEAAAIAPGGVNPTVNPPEYVTSSASRASASTDDTDAEFGAGNSACDNVRTAVAGDVSRI